jgi:hypothetical protein
MEDSIIQGFVESIKDGQWPLIIGFSLMLFAFFTRKLLLPIIPKKHTDLFVLGLAVILSIAESLRAGTDPLSAVLLGVLCGATAIGFWEAVGKRIRDAVAAWLERRKGASKG